jgi:hypothetical protein
MFFFPVRKLLVYIATIAHWPNIHRTSHQWSERSFTLTPGGMGETQGLHGILISELRGVEKNQAIELRTNGSGGRRPPIP